MKKVFRCDCPITTALDILGDKWTLVIIKQMLTEERRTFKDFTDGEEAIATNILTIRLKMLEEYKIIRKEKLPNNKKTNIYILTEKGIALAPVIFELALWSDSSLREFHPTLNSTPQMQTLRDNKNEFIDTIVENYKKTNWEQE